jgi:TonB-dependent receptor
MLINFQLAAPYGLDAEAVGKTVTDPDYFLKELAFNNVNKIKDTLSYLYHSYYSFGSVEQTNYTGNIDLERSIKIGNNLAGFIKIGAKYRSEKRDRFFDNFADQQYYLKPALTDLAIANDPRGNNLATTATHRVQMSNFNDQKNIDIQNGKYNIYPSIPEKQIRDWYTYHSEAGGVGGNTEYTYDYNYAENNYDSFESITSGYLMLKLNYGDLITLVPGLRYEYSNNIYHGVYSTINGDVGQNGYADPDTSGQKYGNWLPNMHLKIKPISWLDLRLSATKTISRPNYMWVIPRFRYNALSNVVAMANPDLKHASSWNYDANITVYTNKFGLLTFGGYLKNINDMFYQVSGTLSPERAVQMGLPAQAFNLSEDYVNLDESWVRGLEFEYNTHFNFLPSPYNRFVLGFNLTRLWSGTYYYVWRRIEGLVMYKDVRPMLVVDFNKSYYDKTENRMPSQVDWTANGWLGYEFKGFSSRISVSYQGNNLTGINPNTDKKGYYTYTDSYLRIDITAKQRIAQKINILLNLNNITNATERGFRYKPIYPTYKHMYGFTFDLGVEINLQ